MDYKKYLKYKHKYLSLKNKYIQVGSGEGTWKLIINILKQRKFDIIYFSIGSGMGNYYYEGEEHKYNQRLITSNNNQQYPEFLNNYKRKLIILIDPNLEEDLQIIKYYKNRDRYLNKYNIDKNIRLYENNDDVIIAATELFDDKEYNIYITDIILTCFDTKTKVIYQSFLGEILSNKYRNLLNKLYYINRNDILKNVLFNVGYDTGNSSPILPTKLLLDNNNDFIQPKFIPLTLIPNGEFKKQEKKERLDFINSHSFFYRKFIEDKSYNSINIQDYKSIKDYFNEYISYFRIYNIDFDFNKINDHNYGIDKILSLIKAILNDVITSTNSDLTLEEILNTIYDARILMNT
jgi:hypothetical protein